MSYFHCYVIPKDLTKCEAECNILKHVTNLNCKSSATNFYKIKH